MTTIKYLIIILALQRSQDDSLPPDDLDIIQLELELLLSTVAMRYRVLKSEYESIDRDDRREKDRKTKYLERQPSSPGKRKKLEDKPSKSKDAKFSSGGPPHKIKKSSTISVVPSPAPSQQTDDSMDEMHGIHVPKEGNKLMLPKNDAPSRFWLSVEPYCMPISNEDIKLLDGLIDEYSGPLIPQIPDLGPHYSQKWAAEDLKDDQDNSNPNVRPKSKVFTPQNQNEANALVKKGEKLMGENVTGPLTQRLVCALLEENLMQDQNIENGNFTNQSSNRSSGVSNMKNGIMIERRVRKELIEQGLLDPDDIKPVIILLLIKSHTYIFNV